MNNTTRKNIIMNKQHLILLLITTCGFMPQAFSAAHFFKRLALGTYKAKSILTGAGLTGFSGYKLYSNDQTWEADESIIKKTCNQLNTYQKEDQEKFRAILKSIIPQSEFKKLQIPNPLNSFFRCKDENYASSHSVNSPYYNIIYCPDDYIDGSMDLVLKHECAHILHRDCSKRKEAEQNYYQNILLAAALLTGYRIKDSISSSAKQVFKKNISSLGLFGMYALYNQYNTNQILIGQEREADRFAIKLTKSVKELQKAATDLDTISWERREEIWEENVETITKEAISNGGLKEEDPQAILIRSNLHTLSSLIKAPYFYCLKSALYNDFFVIHPQTEERIAKIQEKIDLLKAQEAATEKQSYKS